MYTLRKRHLKKKRFFLPYQKTFAIFNASNLKTSEVSEVHLSLQNAKLYFVPLYLIPPKLARGCPIIMIVYDTVKDIQTTIFETSTRLDCLGISIDSKWYTTKNLKKDNIKNLTKNLLAVLLLKKTKLI